MIKLSYLKSNILKAFRLQQCFFDSKLLEQVNKMDIQYFLVLTLSKNHDFKYNPLPLLTFNNNTIPARRQDIKPSQCIWCQGLKFPVGLEYYINNPMGKKLRNREIFAQTDIQIDTRQDNEQQAIKINKSQLKKTIMKKFDRKANSNPQRRNKYFQKIENGEICAIVDSAQLECPICLQLMVRPTLMNCGHMYCHRCLESNSVHNSTCCLCRTAQNQNPYILSRFAQNLINEVLVPRSNEIIKYLCRTTDVAEWIKKREIKNVKVGTILDYQDDYKVWRKAIVFKTFVGNKNQMMLQLKTFIKGSPVQQTIEASSKRLAPCNFFTCSVYLEQFAPVLPQFDLYQKELECLEYRSVKSQDDLFNFNQPIEDEPTQNQLLWNEQVSSNMVDQALALFEWEMNGGEIVI